MDANSRRKPRSDRQPMDPTYGLWTVLDPTEHARDGKVACVCSCGTKSRVRRDKLRQGASQSCGCRLMSGKAWNTAELAPARATSVYPGATIGRWTVKTEIRPSHKRHTESCPADCTLRNNRTVDCECACGNTGTIAVTKLRDLKSLSCGCLRVDAGRDRLLNQTA